MDLAHDISGGFAKGEAAESSIDAFIGKRDKQRRQTEGERAAEAMWAESVRRFHDQQRQRHRAEWCEHFERMRTLHSGLADEYDAKLRRLEQTA